MDFTTINQKVIIPASPEEVYEAYVDPKKHSAFTGSKATGKERSAANLLRGMAIFLGSTWRLKRENVWFKNGLLLIGKKIILLPDWN